MLQLAISLFQSKKQETTTMTLTAIERIGTPLGNLLRERGIIARCELLNRTYDFVRAAQLSPSEEDDLKRLVGEHVAAGVFANLLSDAPIFLDIPRLDTYTLLGDKIFHFNHTKKYGKQDFDNAYCNFQASISELRTVIRQNMNDLLTEFMAEAGYKLIEKSSGTIVFEASGKRANCQLFTSIRTLNLDGRKEDPEADYIFLVPSGDNLEPFMRFFREKGAAFEGAGIQIWVVNLEAASIDPFIGYTTDLDIYRQFKNPRLAEMVRSTWGSKGSA
jgi:hypothetical protein